MNCMVEGCSNPSFSRKMCRAHYHRYRRHESFEYRGNGTVKEQAHIRRDNELAEAKRLYGLASNLETRRIWAQKIKEIENDIVRSSGKK